LADYIQSIHDQTTQYWSAHDAGDAKGFLIAIGVKPNGYTRAWCDAIDGHTDDNTLRAFEEMLGSVKPLDVKNGPIAFAIEIVIDDSSVIIFLELPSVWTSTEKPLMVPDELFGEIWPNS
jgi:hypothetical protein